MTEKQNPFEYCATSIMADAIHQRLDPNDEIGRGTGRPMRFYEAAERVYRELIDAGYLITEPRENE